MAGWATDDPSSGAVDQVEAARRAGIPMKTSGSYMVDGVTYHYDRSDVIANGTDLDGDGEGGKDPHDSQDWKVPGLYQKARGA